MIRNFLGAEDKFIWWKGVVEEREDPLLLGRCKVRIFGWHTQDKAEMPTDFLPWSYPLLPLDNGTSVVGPKLGDWVVGFFRDGMVGQEPIMTGVIPGIPEDPSIPTLGFYDPTPDDELSCEHLARPEPQCITKYRIPTPVEVAGDCCGPIPDVLDEVPEVDAVTRYPLEDRLKEPSCNRIERNEVIEKTYIEFKRHDLGKAKLGDHHDSGVATDMPRPEDIWEEPVTPYAAKYPFNHLYQSESGHHIHIDDTPGDNQRMEWWHRAGSFKEIHPHGTEVRKTRRQRYDFVLHEYFIAGYKSINITSGTKMRLQVGEEYNLHSGGDLNQETEHNFNKLIRIDANTRVQNDCNKVVDIDQNWKIKNYRNSIVENHVNNHFKANEHTKIDGSKNTKIDIDLNTLVGNNANVEIMADGTLVVNGNLRIAIKGDLKIGVDGNIVIDTKSNFTVNGQNVGIKADLVARLDAGLEAEVSAGVNVSNRAPNISMNGYTTGDIYAVEALIAVPGLPTFTPTPLPVPELPPATAPHTYSVPVPLVDPEDPERGAPEPTC